MDGTIEYSSPINHEPFYQLINFENGKLYAVEVRSLSGNHLSDSSWVPGDACCALFALTQDEFELKDSNIKSLDELVVDLYNKIPEDRLMEAYYITIDNQRKAMQPRTDCETIDDNKFRKYIQRAYALKTGIPFFNSAEKVYMIYDDVTTDKFPAITWDGFANIFTRREYAQNLINDSEIATLKIREFLKHEFDEYIKTWHVFGIQNFYLNAGTQDHTCSILRDDYMPDPISKSGGYSGSLLCAHLLRYRQYIEYNADRMKYLAQMFFNHFCQEVKETLFLCPFVYDNENYPLSEPDYILHTSKGSVKLITRKSLSEYLDADILSSSNEFRVTVNGENVTLTNDNLNFYGGQKYQLADSSNISVAGVMHPLTVNGNDGAFIPAFTDFDTLHSIFGENVRVSIYTYDELRAFSENDAELNGVIINPNSATMPIWKKDMDLIEKINAEKSSKRTSGNKIDIDTKVTPNSKTESNFEKKSNKAPICDDISFDAKEQDILEHKSNTNLSGGKVSAVKEQNQSQNYREYVDKHSDNKNGKGYSIFIVISLIIVVGLMIVWMSRSFERDSYYSSKSYDNDTNYSSASRDDASENPYISKEKQDLMNDIIRDMNKKTYDKLKDLDISSLAETAPTVKTYITDVPYTKGTITNNVFHSDFANLYGRLPEGEYIWEKTEKLYDVVDFVDWECGVKEKNSSDTVVGLFTYYIGNDADYDKCVAVLNNLNAPDSFECYESSGTAIFTNMGMNDPKIQDRRQYNIVKFKNESGIIRNFIFNKVNDRMVCVFKQSEADKEDAFSIFCEY